MIVDTILVDLLDHRAASALLLFLSLAYILVFDLEVAFESRAMVVEMAATTTCKVRVNIPCLV